MRCTAYKTPTAKSTDKGSPFWWLPFVSGTLVVPPVCLVSVQELPSFSLYFYCNLGRYSYLPRLFSTCLSYSYAMKKLLEPFGTNLSCEKTVTRSCIHVLLQCDCNDCGTVEVITVVYLFSLELGYIQN